MANFGFFGEGISLMVKGAYWISCKPFLFNGVKVRVGVDILGFLFKRLLSFLIWVPLVCLKVFSLDCIKKLLTCVFTLSWQEFLREFLLILISLSGILFLGVVPNPVKLKLSFSNYFPFKIAFTFEFYSTTRRNNVFLKASKVKGSSILMFG